MAGLTPESTSPLCSIRVVSHRTGLTPETLRVWERRYGFPRPERTPTGRRVYREEDVAKLQLITQALAAGYRPHEVVASDMAALKQLLGEQTAAPTGQAPGVRRRGRQAGRSAVTVAEVLTALRQDDAPGVTDRLRQAVAALGPKRFLTDLAAPLLEQVGDEWAAGTLDVRHEHLLSEALSTQIHLLIGQYEPADRHPRVLLATLPDELHGLGLEMVALYLVLLGGEPRVLGPNLPPAQIVQAALALDVDVVGLSVSAAASPQAVGASLQAILPELPRRMAIWLGGAGAKKIALPEDGVQVVDDWQTLEQAFDRAAQRQTPGL